MNSWLIGIACAAIAASAATAESGKRPEILTFEGKAFSWEVDNKVVTWDPVAALDNRELLVGDCGRFNISYKGATWCFASEENKGKFEKRMTAFRNIYVPFAGGRCAYGVVRNARDPKGDPRTFVRIGDELVLNGNFDARDSFLLDTQHGMSQARMYFTDALRAGEITPGS